MPNSHQVFSRLLAMATVFLVLAGGGFAAGTAAPTAKSVDTLKVAMETAINKVKPALVRLHVVAVDVYGGREVKQESFGSGVIIAPNGYVITNHHVAGNAIYITCTLSTKEELDAKLIGTDALSDLSVVQLCPKTPRKFPFASFGDSSALRVGDRVFAMGSPLAFSQSVTMGVVSNTELIIPDIFGDEGLTLDGENVGSLVRWIGHDAQIFPGNSGGPLVNLQGEIIGINEISIGLGGAIPGNLVRSVADQLIKHGRVTRAQLGIAVQPLLKTSTVQHGVLITNVGDGSPADAAGFKEGDILTRINNKAVDVHFKEEMPLFNQMAMSLPIGTPVKAAVIRDGKEVILTVTPKERPEMMQHSKEFKTWGICAANRGKAVVKDEEKARGVRVTSIRTGGPADSAKPALAEGDIITAVAGKPITALTDFASATDAALADGVEQASVLVAFTRDDQDYLTVVKIGLSSGQDRGTEVRKAWLPISTQVLTSDLASALGLAGRTGVRVTQVYPNTTAETAGLHAGDVIVALDGMPIEASQPEDTEELPALVRQYKIGSTVELTVIRGTTEQKISLALPQAPRQPREMKRYRDENYDFSARDIAFIDRVKQELSPEQTGVIIDSVGEGGWAALGRLKSDDLLVAINGKEIADVDALTATMKAIAAQQPETIVLQVQRDGANLYMELQGSWTPAK